MRRRRPRSRKITIPNGTSRGSASVANSSAQRRIQKSAIKADRMFGIRPAASPMAQIDCPDRIHRCDCQDTVALAQTPTAESAQYNGSRRKHNTGSILGADNARNRGHQQTLAFTMGRLCLRSLYAADTVPRRQDGMIDFTLFIAGCA